MVILEGYDIGNPRVACGVIDHADLKQEWNELESMKKGHKSLLVLNYVIQNMK